MPLRGAKFVSSRRSPHFLMGRIQTDIGLFTGIDYGDIVEQLMKLAATARNNLATRTDTLKAERTAVTELTARLLAVQYVMDNLGKSAVFEKRAVSSSLPELIAATVSGNPVEGTYRFTALRMAQRQQLISSGFHSDTESIAAGTMTFRFGSHVERDLALDALRGGAGFERGTIRITDRSGASAEIDLTTAQTIGDILDAISNNTQINVAAVAEGDRIRLIDRTGLEYSNLKVQEVRGQLTAASFGLAAIDVADSVADGQDIVSLSGDLDLDYLNDGNGITRHSALPDITYELRDGTTGSIDLAPIIPGSSEAASETTLGEILNTINAAAPGKLRVEIAADGDRLVICDLTEGSGVFRIQSTPESRAADDLGIAGESAGGEISGRRLLGGLQSVLVSSLGGSQGLGALGAVQLTDRTGAASTVDLNGLETLEEIIAAVNASGVGITASVNAAKNGILLTDTTGGRTSNLIVASADAAQTAGKLNIAVNDAVNSRNSGDLHQRIVSENTRLADLNGGQGVHGGTIRITDSGGLSATIAVASDIETVGDLVREINRSGARVYAELNPTGDGIWIRDTAAAGGTLKVEDVNSTAAHDLHLVGGSQTREIDGGTVQVVDGSATYRIDVGDGEPLSDLVERINSLGGAVEAMIVFDGSARPYRLALSSAASGAAGAVVVDTSGLGIEYSEIAAARDALLALGETNSANSKVLISSRSNVFDSVITGVRLEIQGVAASPVTINVASSDTDVVANVQALVENYNRFRESLLEYTKYDAESDTRSILTGDAAALRLDTELSYWLSGRFLGAGSIESLAELGIDMNGDGTLTFDSAALKTRFSEDPDAVKKFFTDETYGLSAKFHSLSERLSGLDDSLLTSRYQALTRQIEDGEERIASMDEQLEIQRERLMRQFYQMELAIAKLQSNMSFLDSIKPIRVQSNSKD